VTLERGWHPDPTGRFSERYWNGTRWTSQVHSGGWVTTDPFERPPEPEPEPEPEPPPHPDAAERRPLLDLSELREKDGGVLGWVRELYDVKDRPVGKITGGPAAAASGLLGSFVASGESFEVADWRGTTVLRMLRPAERNLLLVGLPHREIVGSVDAHMFGPPFTLETPAGRIGSLVTDRGHWVITDAGDNAVGTVGGGVVRLTADVDRTFRTLALMTLVAVHYDVSLA
jgi:hypothetical protein